MSELKELKAKVYRLIEKDIEDNLTAIDMLRTFEEDQAKKDIDLMLIEMIKTVEFKKQLRQIFEVYEKEQSKKGE